MLPARYRMTRAAEFDATVKYGSRAAQPDIVVHARCEQSNVGPHVGLVVAKSVGNAVQRHRVARRLRHVARNLLGELDPGERIVIRALPGSRIAVSSKLEHQVRTGLRRAYERRERGR